jgi:hypothetical protein
MIISKISVSHEFTNNVRSNRAATAGKVFPRRERESSANVRQFYIAEIKNFYISRILFETTLVIAVGCDNSHQDFVFVTQLVFFKTQVKHSCADNIPQYILVPTLKCFVQPCYGTRITPMATPQDM